MSLPTIITAAGLLIPAVIISMAIYGASRGRESCDHDKETPPRGWNP